MNPIKYNIGGSIKSEPEHCINCDDGRVFLNETYTKDGDFCSPMEEKICSACNTKYKFPRMTPERVPNKNCAFYSKEQSDCLNTEYLCLCNIKVFVKDIYKINEMEASKMNLIDLKNKWRETGVCSHIWAKTKPSPLKTPEGNFEITSCLVCRTGKVNYKGVDYEDDLMKLVTFIAQKGIDYEKKSKEKVEIFNEITGSNQSKPDTTELDNLFKEPNELDTLFV